MRKFEAVCLIVVIFLLAWFLPIHGADYGAPVGKNTARAVFPAELGPTKLLDASPAAATGVSAVTDIGMTPREMKCTVIAGGTAPTSWNFAFYTGPDSTNMSLAYPTGTTSTTVTSFPSEVYFGDSYGGNRYWKINNIATVGGDATTTYTVYCTALK